ncbi:MAG TPA: peptidase S15, partial [Acinetobacter parvus]|nr:peptidase S15 [Acinetobacter parvus]
ISLINKLLVVQTSGTTSVFIPIHSATQTTYMTGSPQLTLNIESKSGQIAPTLFISVAVKSARTGKYQILNEQTTPLNPAKKRLYDQVIQGSSQQDGEGQNIELSSVNAKLHKNDTLGLLINSESIYYQKIRQPKIEAEISGQIILPKLWSETAQ